MRYIKTIVLISLVFLTSSCVKDVVDEGVSPSFLPHFTNGGYTYYIHPSLDAMTWEESERACDNLNAFGYNDWFMPSRDEINLANSAGYGIVGWSSTSAGTYYEFTCHYYCYYTTSYNSDGEYRWSYAPDILRVVFPMRKQ